MLYTTYCKNLLAVVDSEGDVVVSREESTHRNGTMDHGDEMSFFLKSHFGSPT